MDPPYHKIHTIYPTLSKKNSKFKLLRKQRILRQRFRSCKNSQKSAISNPNKNKGHKKKKRKKKLTTTPTPQTMMINIQPHIHILPT